MDNLSTFTSYLHTLARQMPHLEDAHSLMSARARHPDTPRQAILAYNEMHVATARQLDLLTLAGAAMTLPVEVRAQLAALHARMACLQPLPV